MDSNIDEIKVECVEILSEEEEAPSLNADGQKEGSAAKLTSPNTNAEFGSSESDMAWHTLSTSGDGVGEKASLSSNFLSPFVFERNEKEIVIRFIELVRACPEIWDLTSAAYREKILRRRSLRKIGEQMSWSYEEVLKKYNNLRTYYTKELIKTRRNSDYISRWPYFEHLDAFLRKTVHIRQQKHRQQHKWTRLLSNRNTSDRASNYGGTQLSTGFRVRRQLPSGSSNNIRPRPNSVLSRLNAMDRPPTSSSAYTSSHSHSSSMPSVASTSSVPLINISHIAAPTLDSASARERQRERQPSQVSPANMARPLRLHVQSNAVPQSQVAQSSPQQLQQQQTHHRASTQQQQQNQQQQQQQRGVAAQSIQIRNVHSQSKERTPRSVQPPPTSSSASSTSRSRLNEMETSDMIFGKLIASQLAKIKEGRKKEQLKISLMQHIMQAMFDNGDSSLDI